ncbi:DUF4168 domain-containing protein [Nostoc sp. TCL26-01]|uniref:DUF4168 domain-containing protein n=1 Tax=Nostoc sp. TCL26-01 TaxID=2576904 RepID=UPI002118CBCB|nr:DUF4168 domain-containing protein [Nostoc sp. TCL26-01]
MSKKLAQTLFFSIFTSASLVFSTLTWNFKADAQTQTFNNTEITNYAQAVLAMEPARQQAFGEIKKIIGDRDIPKIVCNDPKSMNSLPNKARDIAVNYCNQSQKIVGDYGLTIDRFNLITMEVQNNSTLKRQLYKILIRLQNDSKPQ